MNRPKYSLIATLAAVLAVTFFCPTAKAYLYNLTPGGGGSYSIAATPVYVTLNNPRLNAAAGGAAGAGAQTVTAWVLWDQNAPPPPNDTTKPAGVNNPPIANGIPVPVLTLTVGQVVTVNFQNNLVVNNNGAAVGNNRGNLNDNSHEGASIHWHGIELDNDSDGVAVTQDSVKPGQSYTYRFQATRPGLFWFHSHMVPGDTLFAGMYGIIYVKDACEIALIQQGKLPASGNYPPAPNTANTTFPLALSDIEWDTIGDANQGQVGRVDVPGGIAMNAGPANTWYNINQWILNCGNGFQKACGAGAFPGETVLVNGANPDTMKGLVTWSVVAGQTIRFQLFNEALTRNFDVYLWDPVNKALVPLIRIGGQGGVLNYARIEGDNADGTNNFGWATGYAEGHISLSSGTRADAVACVPNIVTTANQPLTLWAYNNTANWPLQQNANAANGWTIPPAQATTKDPPGGRPPGVDAGLSYPIAYFNVVAGSGGACPIANGTPLRAALGPPCSPEMVLTNGGPVPPNGGLITPPAGAPGGAGLNAPNATISLTKAAGTGSVSIDNNPLGAANNFMDGNNGGGVFVQKYQVLGADPPTVWTKTDRYAYVGSTLVLAVRNNTGAGMSQSIAHPFHLHGFSMQPISMVDGNGEHFFNANTANYEFLDTIDVYAGQTYNFSVRLDDRQKFCDSAAGGPQLNPCMNPAAGGALGRWLYHCHIGEHGVNGMIGEIIVLPNNNNPVMVQQPPDASNTGVDVLATFNTPSQIVADDFQWVNPGGPITNVVIWGSWLNDNVDPNATFELKFWTDVPTVIGPPSRPGWQAWQMMFPPGTYTNYGYTFVPGGEWFLVPGITNIPSGDSRVYQYGFPIPLASGFSPQVINGTNWLSVTEYPSQPGVFFGWKTCVLGTGWNDDSTWSPMTWGPPWTELLYLPPHPYSGNPYPANSMNQAFALYVVPSGVAPGTPTLSGSIVAAPGPVVLSATLSGDLVNISWVGGGILQYADEVAGPWSDLNGATSPYPAPADGPHRFYRVRVPR